VVFWTVKVSLIGAQALKRPHFGALLINRDDEILHHRGIEAFAAFDRDGDSFGLLSIGFYARSCSMIWSSSIKSVPAIVFQFMLLFLKAGSAPISM